MYIMYFCLLHVYLFYIAPGIFIVYYCLLYVYLPYLLLALCILVAYYCLLLRQKVDVKATYRNIPIPP